MFPLTATIPSWRMALILVLAGLLAMQSVRLANEQSGHAETKAQHAQAQAKQQEAARQATDAARAEEQRRTQAIQEIADDAQHKFDLARADAARARAERDSLRSQLANFVAGHRQATGDSTASDAGPPGGSALNLLADLFTGADDAAGELAQALERSHAAGTACERAYDAVRNGGYGQVSAAQ